MRDSFEHDIPLQQLEIGESCTYAANTSKLYVWGLNNEYKSLENSVQIKTKQAVESFHVERNSALLNFADNP